MENSLRDELKDEINGFLSGLISHDDGTLVMNEEYIREMVPDLCALIFEVLTVGPDEQDMPRGGWRID